MFAKLSHGWLGWVIAAIVLALGYYAAFMYPGPLDSELERGEVYVYFVDNNSNAEEVLAVRRDIEPGLDLESAIPLVAQHLLAGPNASEAALSTAIPQGVTLISSEVSGGVATLNFSDEIENVAGSATVILLYKQIEMTFDHLAGVREVRVLVEGEEPQIEP